MKTMFLPKTVREILCTQLNFSILAVEGLFS
jgi:hypothetical protein